jgi:hypothetical protein
MPRSSRCPEEFAGLIKSGSKFQTETLMKEAANRGGLAERSYNVRNDGFRSTGIVGAVELLIHKMEHEESNYRGR